jgi:type IV secretory pathway VirB10-like protein
MAAARKTPPRGSKKRTKRASKTGTKRAPTRRWSHHVMETSDALDLESSVFAHGSARQIALSLKRSAERSRRRKSSPFRSAMSMLNFYINRSGTNSSPTRLRVLNQAKDELRDVFHRT